MQVILDLFRLYWPEVGCIGVRQAVLDQGRPF